MENSDVRVRKAIFIPMSIIFSMAVIMGAFFPDHFLKGVNTIVAFANDSFGWLFLLAAVFFLVACLFLLFSKFGSIRLGGENAKPEYSNWYWFAISLTAGIATGILFWAIAEPIFHFMAPPEVLGLAAGSEAAAMFSMGISYLHWSFVPYAMYGICGIGIAYAIYNMNLPYNVSSTLYPIFGKKTQTTVGAVVDNLCLFAMGGAVAAMLGVATLAIGAGLEVVFGISQSRMLWLAIMIVIVLSYVISSYTGLNRGIKWLADKNSKLFIVMMGFVFIIGPTAFILDLGTQSLGYFLQNFLTLATWTSPIEGSSWPQWWPVYYWAIWIAYAPLIGMFLARLAKGRTIRQFMLVNLILPSFFGIFWFAVFGGTSIYYEIHALSLWDSIQSLGLEVAVFAFLQNLPFATLLSIGFIFALYISVVTLADSMTNTVASLSTTAHNQEEKEPPVKIKFFWGIVMCSLTFVNLARAGDGSFEGIDATKEIATVAGFPTLFLMILMTVAILYMIVRREKFDMAYHPETAKATYDKGEGILADIKESMAKPVEMPENKMNSNEPAFAETEKK
ncbi:BCCT family transporter [Tindallia californiensis]|uniref:Choline/carnitine/betaine transport n=1 Tax=Tindallia californiensis TaxID=159292 RepID=A0A1H3MI56_9FIRM|nr:BCCT family transporter [Tindallia californiensis]SDY76014.1 choline/carnitine/betaine transport [Tindallia californiensis]